MDKENAFTKEILTQNQGFLSQSDSPVETVAIKTTLQLYWPLILLLIGYLLTIVILALRHKFIYLSEGVLIPVLLLTAALSFQLKKFLNDWSIYLATLTLFNALRGFDFAVIRYWKLDVHQNYVIQLEKFFVFNAIAPSIIQNFFNHNEIITSADKLLAAFYGTHFITFMLLGLVIWFVRREEFWNYKIAFILLSSFGILCFLLLPTMPPWMASQHQLIPKVMPLAAEIYNTSIPNLFVKFNSDPVASMPSLHAGFATLCTLIAFRLNRGWGLGFVIYSGMLFLSCLVLGAHYLIDLIVGALLGVVFYFLVYHTSYFIRWQPISGKDVTLSLLAKKITISIVILFISFAVAKISTYFLQHAV